MEEHSSAFHFDRDGQRFLPASVVAKRLCRTTRMVRYLAQNGDILAFKRGKLWYFAEKAVESYSRLIQNGGRHV
jgi:hypothetical protein